jgi:hypothetical protein
MVQTLRSRRSHPSLSDGIGSRRPERRANLPYPEAPHATIEACSIATVAIMNQKSRRSSIPGAAFHDLLRDLAGMVWLGHLVRRQLDAFINPLVYTSWGSQGPSIMTVSAALAEG